MAELRHYQRAFLPTQRLVILFHRQHFTATAHASHWRALLAALKAQDKDGENDPAAMSALAACASVCRVSLTVRFAAGRSGGRGLPRAALRLLRAAAAGGGDGADAGGDPRRAAAGGDSRGPYSHYHAPLYNIVLITIPIMLDTGLLRKYTRRCMNAFVARGY
jgi:hypothetical protein